MKSHADAIEAHFATHWQPPFDRARMTKGNIAALSPEFRVVASHRQGDSSMDVHATVCMSWPDDTDPLELHIFTPPSKGGLFTRSGQSALPSIVESLHAVACFHRSTHLGLGHTVNFGTPWMPGSACTYGLISLPYIDGPKLEWLEQPKVRCLWLIPITEAERNFKKEHGLEALEQHFEAAQFNYLDPRRPSVV